MDPALCLLCPSTCNNPALFSVPLASIPEGLSLSASLLLQKSGAQPPTPHPVRPRQWYVGLIFSPSGFPGLELNGMTVTGLDMAEVPPPLPLKGSTADYGNLMETQDLVGSPVPPPPPLHQRVSRKLKRASLPFSLHRIECPPPDESVSTSGAPGLDLD